MSDPIALTTLHYVVLAVIARHSPARPADIAATLGLPVSLVQALLADLELAEMIASSGGR